MILSKANPSRLRVLVPSAYCAGIFFLSSVPGNAGQQDGLFLWVKLPPLVQNLLHVPVFAGLAWGWAWALRGWQPHRSRRIALAFLLTALYAVIDEGHQSLVPDRTASLVDLGLDLAGALLGVLVAFRTGARAAS